MAQLTQIYFLLFLYDKVCLKEIALKQLAYCLLWNIYTLPCFFTYYHVLVLNKKVLYCIVFIPYNILCLKLLNNINNSIVMFEKVARLKKAEYHSTMNDIKYVFLRHYYINHVKTITRSDIKSSSSKIIEFAFVETKISFKKW